MQKYKPCGFLLGLTLSVGIATVPLLSARAALDEQQKYELVFKAGMADLNSGRYAAAVDKLKKASVISEGVGSASLQLTALTRLGDAYKAQKNYADALKSYKQAYDINVETNRGQYIILLDSAKGMSDVYKATGQAALAGNILKDARAVRASRYSVAAVDDADAFAAYYNTLRQAVMRKDSKATAALFKYPLNVRWNASGANGKVKKVEKSFASPALLAASFGKVFTPNMVSIVTDTPEQELWCRDQGITIGGGAIWLTNVAPVTIAGKPTYRIQSMTINADPPSR